VRANLDRLGIDGVERRVFDRGFGGPGFQGFVDRRFVWTAEQVGTVLLEEIQRLLFEEVIVALVHGLNLTGCQ